MRFVSEAGISATIILAILRLVPLFLCKFEYVARRATVTYLRTAGWVIMVATVPPYDHASMTPRSII